MHIHAHTHTHPEKSLLSFSKHICLLEPRVYMMHLCYCSLLIAVFNQSWAAGARTGEQNEMWLLAKWPDSWSSSCLLSISPSRNIAPHIIIKVIPHRPSVARIAQTCPISWQTKAQWRFWSWWIAGSCIWKFCWSSCKETRQYFDFRLVPLVTMNGSIIKSENL